MALRHHASAGQPSQKLGYAAIELLEALAFAEAANYFDPQARIVGTFHHASEAHLSRYLAEFDFRYSNRAHIGVTDAMRAAECVRGVVGKRLTYDERRKAAQPGTEGPENPIPAAEGFR